MTPREDKAFLLLLVAISAAFAWILLPFYAAVLWGTSIAIVFAPVNRRLRDAFRQRRTPAALATVGLVLVIVILPVTLLTAVLVQEASDLVERMRSGEIDVGRYLRQIHGALPEWVMRLLDHIGLTTFAAVQERLSAGLLRASELAAPRALSIGQYTFEFFIALAVMLYLLFFLLRDGEKLVRALRNAIPLHPAQLRALAQRFAEVVRATVKGNVVVALMQGALGGLIFWLLGIHAPLLWAAVMAVLSLLPAVGAGLVWLPAALYLLATGAVWKGIALIAFGVLVIGLVDNVMRPILVGKDTGMPDYVVLISTLGGIYVFGVNGFLLGPVIAALFIAAWGIYAAANAEP